MQLYVALCPPTGRRAQMAWLAAAVSRVPGEVAQVVCAYAGLITARAAFADADASLRVEMRMRGAAVEVCETFGLNLETAVETPICTFQILPNKHDPWTDYVYCHTVTLPPELDSVACYQRGLQCTALRIEQGKGDCVMRQVPTPEEWARSVVPPAFCVAHSGSRYYLDEETRCDVTARFDLDGLQADPFANIALPVSLTVAPDPLRPAELWGLIGTNSAVFDPLASGWIVVGTSAA